MSLTGAAGWIRDGWFKLLGSTQGFPYNSGIFFTAFLFFSFEGPIDLPDGTVITASILDSTGALVGSGSAAIPPVGGQITVPGTSSSFDVNETYSIEISVSGPHGGFVGASFNGKGLSGLTFTGASLASKSSPPMITLVEVNPVTGTA